MMSEKLLKSISSQRIAPEPVSADISVTQLIETAMLSYNGGRLREACRLFSARMLQEHAVVGLALSGALTPAGVGISCIAPLIRAGFIDWMVSTGANLYHDVHFALGKPLYQSHPALDDQLLRANEIIRIYDIVFDYQTLLDTDAFFMQLVRSEPFQKTMSSAEFHSMVGRYLLERDQQMNRQPSSLLAVASECGVPIYTSSPGDSSIGMNIARAQLEGYEIQIDPSLDVNETAAIVYQSKQRGESGVLILGGGSPKNFVLQTEPHIQEVLGLSESGHDYFIQFTDARPDTGGLSGATPSEAMTWGKIDPEKLPNSVTCYVDSTVAVPLLTAFALQAVKPRPLRRLGDHRHDLVERMRAALLRPKQ